MPYSKKLALNWYFSGPTENYWNEAITCQYYKYILERVWSELIEYSPDKYIGSVVWQIVWLRVVLFQDFYVVIIMFTPLQATL